MMTQQLLCRITFNFEVNVANIDINNCTLKYADSNGGSKHERFGLIIGADGRNSQVRQAMQLHNPRLKTTERSVDRFYKSFTGLPPEGATGHACKDLAVIV